MKKRNWWRLLVFCINNGRIHFEILPRGGSDFRAIWTDCAPRSCEWYDIREYAEDRREENCRLSVSGCRRQVGESSEPRILEDPDVMQSILSVPRGDRPRKGCDRELHRTEMCGRLCEDGRPTMLYPPGRTALHLV